MIEHTPSELYREHICRVVHSIPYGKVTSYGEVAKRAGLPRGARLVGRVLAQLPASSALPWHRVVNSRGCISFPQNSAAYARQRELLLREGVAFHNDKINWQRFGWQ